MPAMRPTYPVTELLGDGIGAELSRAIHTLSDALPIGLDFTPVDLTLTNPWFDMQTVCFALDIHDEEDARLKAIHRFLDTKLAKDLNRDAEPAPFPMPDQIKSVGDSPDTGQRQVFEVNLVLGRIPRVFLFRIWPEKTRLNAVVVGCRKSRFAGEEETLHKLLDAAKLEDVKN